MNPPRVRIYLSDMAGHIKREGKFLVHWFLTGKFIVAVLIQRQP